MEFKLSREAYFIRQMVREFEKEKAMKPNEKVTSMDMTFCIWKKCSHKRCDRHQYHMIEPWFYPVSYADFANSEYCETAKLAELKGTEE